MFSRKFVSILTLFVCLACAAHAQSPSDTTAVPLTVDRGVPVHVALLGSLHIKENEFVRAKVIEPVFAFDREVIPVGTELEGKVVRLQSVGKWKKISSLLGGDFTPLHEPVIEFRTLVFSDGTRIDLETSVVPAAEKTVGLDAEKSHSGL